MRFLLVIVLVALVLIVFCESKPAKKQSRSKDHSVKKSTKPAKSDHLKTSNKHNVTKSSKKSKVGEKKAKITKPRAEKTSSSNNHKDKSNAKDKMTKSKTPANSKTKPKTKSEKQSKLESSAKKVILKTIPKNCDELVQQYTDGQLVMYEYKIKMAKCLKAEKSKKKSDVPSSAVVNPQPSVDTSVPLQQVASYYPSQDISNLDQPQTVARTDAAFSPNPIYNQAAPAQQNYNYYARSSIPAAPQAQDASQQWNAANIALAQPKVDANNKKAILPAAPNSNDAFAQFMNIQSSQDTASQPIQQRSDIPSDQPYDAMPVNQQAYFRQQYRYWSPEDHGMFPENP